MPRVNKSKYALLGVLSLGPQSGYDIKKFVEEVLGFFWNESFGQIYPLLRILEQEGLIRKQARPRATKAGRSAFVLTAAGRKELREWVAQPANAEPVRSELLLKIFFGQLVGSATSVEQIEHFETGQRHLSEVLRHAQMGLAEEMRDDPKFPYWKMTLRLGQLVNEARLTWCKECLASLKELGSAGDER